MDKNAILIELSESDRTAHSKQDFSEQSIPQKVFSAVWAVEAEVNNGGFSQYFFNHSSETAGFVVEALETIGAPKTADICRRAIVAAFPDGLPQDFKQTRLATAEFSDETGRTLNALDNEFYQYPHDLTELLFSYVASHPQDFGDLADFG